MRAMPMSTPSLLTQAGASGRAMARRNEHVRRLPAHSIDRRAFSAPPLPGHLVILTKLSPPFFSPPCAIFAYYLCGWLCDLCGRRYVIPGFVLPASILLVILGHLDSPSGLFWVGLVLNFLITASFGAGVGYNTELFPTQIRGTAVGGLSPSAVRQRRLHRRSSVGLRLPIRLRRRCPPRPLVLPARTDVPVRGSRNDAQGARRFRRPKDLVASPSPPSTGRRPA